jgi:phasin family protein
MVRGRKARPGKAQPLRKAGAVLAESAGPTLMARGDSPAVATHAYIPLERDDVEALAKSSVALTDGVEAFGRELFDFQRQSLTAGLATMRALIDARNLEDVVDLHGRYVRGSVENLVREGGRLAELANKVANETWQPLQSRAAARARKLAKPAGA